MKNLQTKLLGRFVTLNGDTSNRLHSVVAIWLPDGEKTPSVAVEPVNQFGRATGGQIVRTDLSGIQIA